ncbi:MAG: thermonuclease family protein [Methylophilaceae bacterium]|jgi:endonuclease YncB( thermonuclease family)|nr:thermonuclease family protein [Methylophilaceae bacterium]
MSCNHRLKITLLTISLLLPTSCLADIITGRVVAITDGDSIRILDSNNNQFKIRLIGIDAPEKKQAFGNVSKQSLSELVSGKIVNVNYSKRGRYGRIVGKVLLDNKDINLEQVKRGLAWHYKQYEREQDVADRALYTQGEHIAQKANLGLWNDKNPVPPWDFRKMPH